MEVTEGLEKYLDISTIETRSRIESPVELKLNKTYEFIIRGQRVYPLKTDITLRQIDSTGKPLRELALVRIIEATHFLLEGEVMTKGLYNVLEVYENTEDKI
jgi:hypothetical protein